LTFESTLAESVARSNKFPVANRGLTMRRRHMLTRRDVLKSVGLGFAGIAFGTCGSGPTNITPLGASEASDFSSRLASFQPAVEPDVADLSAISSPDF